MVAEYLYIFKTLVYWSNFAPIKQAIRICTFKFLWKSQFFKIAREQLYLPIEKGGVGLMDPEMKIKSLFIKLVLYGHKNSPLQDDHFMMNNDNLKLSRNTTEWLQKAKELKKIDLLNTSKLIYMCLLQEKTIILKIEQKFPHLDWETIWANFKNNFISSEAKETLYFVFNDVVANRDKMFNCCVQNIENALCEICGKRDTNFHRIKDCEKSDIIWNWVEDVVKNKLNFQLQPTKIFSTKILEKDYKSKAALFVVAEAIHYQMRHYENPSLFCFQQRLRVLRWNNRTAFKNTFQNCINFF